MTGLAIDSLPNADSASWLLDRSDDAALITDAAGVIEYVNPAFERLTGYARDEAVGRRPSILKSGRQSEAFYQRLWRTVRGGEEFRDVMVNRRRDGGLYHEEKTIRPLFDHDGRIAHFLACGRDVSERIATLERLAHAATHDALTGLPNRALFLERLQQALARSRRSGEPLIVAILDLDRFKAVNDEFGHQAGDAVLQAAAQRLRRVLRESDTVARLGGDEFGLLLEAGDDAARVLTALSDACAEPVQWEGGRPLLLGVSIGATVCRAGATDATTLLRQADLAMYRAKREGGQRFRMHEPAPADHLAEAAAGHGERDPALLLAQVPVLRRVVRAGDAIYRAGERFRDVHLLRAGLCKLVSVTRDGHEELSALLFKGDWLGFDGLVSGEHACTALAADTGELWTMHYDALLRAAARTPQLLEVLHLAMARQSARERDAVLSRHTLPADGKVADFLCRWAENLDHTGQRTDQIMLRVTRAEIGGHLGLRLESVSRAMTRLVDEGLIRLASPNRRELAIPSLSALRGFVHRLDAAA